MALVSGGVLIWAFSGSRRLGDEPLCLWCGYDLTGNESGVCPECGRRIPKAILWLIRQRPVGPPGSRPAPPTVEPADMVGMGPAEGEGTA